MSNESKAKLEVFIDSDPNPMVFTGPEAEELYTSINTALTHGLKAVSVMSDGYELQVVIDHVSATKFKENVDAC